MSSKTFKLKNHRASFCSHDLVINFESFAKHSFVDGDVLEIKAIEADARPLCLKVTSLPLDIQQKGGPISIMSDVAQLFSLTGMKSVTVKKKDKEEVKVDLVELTVKHQSLSQSDMWRFASTLSDTCVFVGKKLTFADIRVQVNSLWSKGSAVESGLIRFDTRILFRSGSAHMFICIQISEEMWEFDPSGTLYFDKAILGFLKDLFDKWTKNGCNHFVNVIFFSRTFYPEAKSKSDFPKPMSASINEDSNRQFFEDFYQVILQSEHRNEWAFVVKELKKNFQGYLQRTNCGESECRPAGKLSRASQGNFLECLNLTINVFERSYLQQNFHLTGCQTLIVTPGVGVFEVDRELARITNERVMDFGVGADLVSLTEQPLHAVPLLKYSSSQAEDGIVSDYAIPHWLNYSFYDPKSKWITDSFQPRIRLPDYIVNCYLKEQEEKRLMGNMKLPITFSSRANTPCLFFKRDVDFDDYDQDVFKKQVKRDTNSHGMVSKYSSMGQLRRHKSNEMLFGSFMPSPTIDRVRLSSDKRRPQHIESIRRTVNIPRARNQFSESSEGNATLQFQSGVSPSSEASFADALELSSEAALHSVQAAHRSVTSGTRNAQHLLINPFQPNNLPQDLTTNKRRWMHAFPFTKEGHAFQLHHAREAEGEGVVLCNHPSDLLVAEEERCRTQNQANKTTSSVMPKSESDTNLQKYYKMDSASVSSDPPYSTTSTENSRSSSPGPHFNCSSISTENIAIPLKPNASKKSKNRKFLNHRKPLFEVNKSNSSGIKPKIVDNFAPVRRTGMDWKALTYPACLPITTDYYPSEMMLENEFTLHPYTLEGSLGDENRQRKSLANLTAAQSFREFISQRLSKGFQIVLTDSNTLHDLHSKLHNQKTANPKNKKHSVHQLISVKMSLGRVYHTLTFSHHTISVSVYKAKHSHKQKDHTYKYQLQPLEHSLYQPARDTFSHQKMEDFNWNYLDQHILGVEDFEWLPDGIKCNRCRYLLLPMNMPDADTEQCERSLTEGFLRFFEFINQIKRPYTSTKKGSIDPVSKPRRFGSRNSSMVSLLIEDPLFSRHVSQESMFLHPDPSTPASLQPTPPASRSGSVTPHLYMESLTSRHSLTEQRQENTPLRFGSEEANTLSPVAAKKRRSDDSLKTKTPALEERDEQIASEEMSPYSSRPDSRTDDEGNDVLTAPTPEVTVNSPNHQRQTSNTGMSDIVNKYSIDEGYSDILKGLQDDRDGLDFVTSTRGQLPSYCFIASEAAGWFMERVEGIHSTKDAIRLGQEMVKANVLVHASRDKCIPFDCGFYLFCIVQSTSSDNIATSLDQSFVIINSSHSEKFRKMWFEAGVVTKELPETSPSATPRSESPVAPLAMRSQSLDQSTDALIKDGSWSCSNTVEINPDTNSLSDRPEWCSVIYDSVFIPHVAYRIEFQWLVSTVSLVAKFVSQWIRKAELCAFRLVPVPTLEILEVQAFSKQHRISLPLDFERMKTLGYKTDPHSIFKMVHKIMKKFGFLLDPASIKEDSDCLYDHQTHPDRSLSMWVENNDISWQSDPVYVHYTGQYLVHPVQHELTSSSTPLRSIASSYRKRSRTESECTLQAMSPELDDVFSDRPISQASYRPYMASTPFASPRHGSSQHFRELTHSDSSRMYEFHWHRNTMGYFHRTGASQPLKTDSGTQDLQSDFAKYCSNINETLTDFRSSVIERNMEDTFSATL